MVCCFTLPASAKAWSLLQVHDVSNIYRVPLLLHHQGVTANTLTRLSLVERRDVPFWNDWRSLAELVDSLEVCSQLGPAFPTGQVLRTHVVAMMAPCLADTTGDRSGRQVHQSVRCLPLRLEGAAACLFQGVDFP